MINVLYEAYTIILIHVSNFLQALGLNDQEATELSPIVLLFLAISITYLLGHTFSALKKYVQGFIILFVIMILVSVLVK